MKVKALEELFFNAGEELAAHVEYADLGPTRSVLREAMETLIDLERDASGELANQDPETSHQTVLAKNSEASGRTA